MIDYAQHLIKIENSVKQCHDHCLDKQYEAAAQKILDTIVECRLLYVTLGEMEAAKKAAEKTAEK